jgi:hypothetical protein
MGSIDGVIEVTAGNISVVMLPTSGDSLTTEIRIMTGAESSQYIVSTVYIAFEARMRIIIMRSEVRSHGGRSIEMVWKPVCF